MATFPRYNLNYTKCSFIFKNRTMQLIWQTLLNPHIFSHILLFLVRLSAVFPLNAFFFFSLWGFKHHSDMNKALWKRSTSRWTKVRGKILWRRGRFPLKGSWHECVHHRRKSADSSLSSRLCKPPKIAQDHKANKNRLKLRGHFQILFCQCDIHLLLFL